MDYDVAIIGGGPAGSTAASILRKYSPALRVAIIERETFPREHIGESQLPVIGFVLDEMGCWDKVEAADFPIKIGATFTWGQNWDVWDFDFYPADKFIDEPRPAKFTGQRRHTAFQVDRAIYDAILLDHAKEMGTEVLQPVKVERIERDADRVTGLVLCDGRTITARHYLDCSGNVGLLRRAMDVEDDVPLELRNIAVWDYWENAEWAVKIGVGGTRIQVRSLPYGWIWFIPLGPTRTSIGLVCPSEHYKKMGWKPDELYHDAISSQPDIARLIANATSEGNVRTTKDWSHLADRIVGDNWFLCGESAGFADPILSAGMSLAHWTAREAAYVILELERGRHDANWLRRQYNDRNRASILQHIRFALYWYSANSCFTDLKDHCMTIAGDAGLRLTPGQAWRWLAQGGFVNKDAQFAAFGSFDLSGAKGVVDLFAGGELDYSFDRNNVFKLNTYAAEQDFLPHLEDGQIHKLPCLRKSGRMLSTAGYFGNVITCLQRTPHITELVQIWRDDAMRVGRGQYNADAVVHFNNHLQALEAMVMDGWVIAGRDKKRPMYTRRRTGQSVFKRA